jgi:serine/threonine protein kinase
LDQAKKLTLHNCQYCNRTSQKLDKYQPVRAVASINHIIMSAKEIPKAWPSEAREFFTPVRALGTGGFGVVWLATRKQQNGAGPSTSIAVNSSSTDSSASPTTPSPVDEQHVAIKLVGHPSCNPINDFTKMSESGYFQRECEVLAEISHHRIVKLIRKIEQTEEERKQTPEASPYCMVLQYCRGPTVEQMVHHGGALGIHLAREVAAQLIDAISFLHGRGVIHRDVKPDNISTF